MSETPTSTSSTSTGLRALERAWTSLERALRELPGYESIAIPGELARLEGSYGGRPVSMRCDAFRARGIGWGRLARMDGPGTWILNAIVYPERGFAVPILGIELLVFRERMHLVVADLFPLVTEHAALMDEIAPAFDALGETPPMPAWAARIFSRRPIFRKPRTGEALEGGADAMARVGRRWMELARGARPEQDPERAANAWRAVESYVRAHAVDEPANPFLGRAFGEARAARLVDEVLFPTWMRGDPT